MKKLFLSIISATVLLIGCATNPTVQDFTPGIRAAAWGGTTYVLTEHPEWRPKFVQASDSLLKLESADPLTWGAIMGIIQTLPVRELKSPEARLAITGATILLEGYGDKIDVSKIENIRPVARAIREGIQQALNASP